MKIGKIYKYSNGTIVLCTDENLETFSGIILKVGKKDKFKPHKLGYFTQCWNADSNWKQVKKKNYIKLLK